jgi:peptidoglycan/xylan/chitin deacetylase (PgdA/CDA1 family)
LGGAVGPQLVQLFRPVSALILAYHNVIQTSTERRGDTSLHLSLADFLEQISWLESQFRIVPLTALLGDTSDAANMAAITFDDAYAGAVRSAIPALVEREHPATIFVCSGWDGKTLPWWDALATAAGLNESIRQSVLTTCGGRTNAALRWAAEKGIRRVELPPEYHIAEPAEIQALSRMAGVTIAMHTHTHPNLTVLPDEDLQSELRLSLDHTRGRYPESVPLLAYPYGLSNGRVVAAARRVGFEGALRISGGPIRNWTGVDRFALPRVNVPSGVSLRGFRLRCLGIL